MMQILGIKRVKPNVLLTDKDRVNRCAILAKILTSSRTKFVVSIGTTVSINLANRGILDRTIQRVSIGRLYKYADRVIVTSEGVADDMARYTGLSKDLIEVVPCPVVDDSLLKSKQQRPPHPWFKPGDPPVILGVGELCMRKDFATLIRAFKIVTQDVDTRLIILGQGKQKNFHKDLAKKLGIANKIDFPGFVDNPYPYMAHGQVFVFSSFGEGLGFVIIEALAVGTPVVATNCPSGPAEILQNGKYGILVPIKQPEKRNHFFKKG
ncbi:hypothetical protein JCM12298_18610 [Desulfothermus naphthae]